MKTSIQTLQTGLLMLILGIITKGKFMQALWYLSAGWWCIMSIWDAFKELLNRKDK